MLHKPRSACVKETSQRHDIMDALIRCGVAMLSFQGNSMASR